MKYVEYLVLFKELLTLLINKQIKLYNFRTRYFNRLTKKSDKLPLRHLTVFPKQILKYKVLQSRPKKFYRMPTSLSPIIRSESICNMQPMFVGPFLLF